MLDYQCYTDNELADLLQESDQLAYAEIYRRFKGVLHLHAYKKLGDFEEAKDVVQEVFLILWEKRERLHVSTNLSGYVYQMLRNRILNLISAKETCSRHFNAIRTFIEQGQADTDWHLREQELAAAIESGINEMPPRMREVFLLSRKSYLSHKEIAHVLSISESTVKNQIKSALRLLRRHMGALTSLYLFLPDAGLSFLLDEFL